MSLLSDNQNWITFGGDPVQGRTPPTVVVRAGKLTPARRGMIAHEYMKFGQARKLSLAGGGYFAGQQRLADGTQVRMVSINNVEHVHIWAGDLVGSEGVGTTFFCQPWDAEWVDEPYDETFTIPRWLEIDDSDAEPENDAVEFLANLTRDEEYEPRNGLSYPGNQTWFAPVGHPLAGTVVSWWGPPKRYAMSERDEFVHAGAVWGRAVWPLTETVRLTDTPDAEIDALTAAPTGGISGGIGEHMFDMLGATALPGGMVATGRPQLITDQLWIDGAPVQAPANVNSACLQQRGDSTFLRIIRMAGTQLSVWELEVSADAPNWELVGTVPLTPVGVGLGAPVGTAVQYSYAWDPTFLHLAQPFHWSADGSKAVSVAHYLTNSVANPLFGGVYPLEAYGTHAVIEVVAAGGVAVALLDQTYETVGTTSSGTSEPDDPGQPYAGTNSTRTSGVTSEYSAPVAAEYIDNDARVLKTHITSDGTAHTAGTATNATAIDTREGVDYTVVYEASRVNTADVAVTYESWASFGGDEIAGTRAARVHGSASVTTRTNEFDTDSGFTGYDAETSNTHTGTGTFGLWGFVAGDLRGQHIVLHNTPISKIPSAVAVCGDAQADFTVTQYDHRTGFPETRHTTVNATVTDRLDAGKLCLVDLEAGSSSVLDNLLAPTMRHNIGTLFVSETAGVVSTSRSGPYGAGPWIGLEDFTSVPSLNPAQGETFMCPFRMIFTFTGTNTSRISINASRSPVRLFGSWESGSFDVVGGYGNTILSAGALTPDAKTQYLGAVMMAMTSPTAKNAPECVSFERWFNEGAEFSPTYPVQDDPENEGDFVAFPHRGDQPILLDPIFIGPPP